MPQLQINQGPQDALLYDNSRSYFTNVGYARTSNFQLELRDVDPQNSANLGSTVQFVIPKAADLLGPCDLMLQFATMTSSAVANTYAAWVESVGFAMIERITFSVGSHDIETITGDQLNIVNELMKTDEQRLGHNQILKTGRAAVNFAPDSSGANPIADTTTGRLISYGINEYTGHKLIVPLGLFFTKHPSSYFPLCAIAGCNDVRIAIKFRTLQELVVLGYTNPTVASSQITATAAQASSASAVVPSFSGSAIKEGSCKLRCHYVHVTGPEATTLMNKEHVRLLKLWQVNSKPVTIGSISSTGTLASLDLSFLHPVQELIITIRKASEMGSSTTQATKPNDVDQKATGKNYFAYHGSGKDPNLEGWKNKTTSTGFASGSAGSTVAVEGFKLTLNGQERHPSLASSGLDRDYLMNRLMPMLHSNTSSVMSDLSTDTPSTGVEALDYKYLSEMIDRKEIYVYPFALNPEGINPSGAVNFSKVSHAKLTIEGTSTVADGTSEAFQVDVYGVYYNWLQIKDGRALTSFA